ncbi:MAG TPA: divergent PAP2 family protein, partial [Planococcus sp. (in: firmicutes)]|nr:divergent PAP2 family protein [Planococcus sp. (in: firmicutes)]
SFELVEREKELTELKELLGHQPIEVLAGATFGTLIGLISAKIENREREIEKQKIGMPGYVRV